jgi:hypothetical protein
MKQAGMNWFLFSFRQPLLNARRSRASNCKKLKIPYACSWHVKHSSGLKEWQAVQLHIVREGGITMPA